MCVLCVAGLRVSVSAPAPGSATGERPCAHRILCVYLSACLPVLLAVHSLPQREPALSLQCFWWLWAQHFAILLFASLSRPQRGQMEPVEGERQTVMLGQPGLPAGPFPPADTHTHSALHCR